MHTVAETLAEYVQTTWAEPPLCEAASGPEDLHCICIISHNSISWKINRDRKQQGHKIKFLSSCPLSPCPLFLLLFINIDVILSTYMQYTVAATSVLSNGIAWKLLPHWQVSACVRTRMQAHAHTCTRTHSHTHTHTWLSSSMQSYRDGMLYEWLVISCYNKIIFYHLFNLGTDVECVCVVNVCVHVRVCVVHVNACVCMCVPVWCMCAFQHISPVPPGRYPYVCFGSVKPWAWWG